MTITDILARITDNAGYLQEDSVTQALYVLRNLPALIEALDSNLDGATPAQLDAAREYLAGF